MLNDFKDEDFDSKIKNEDISVIQFSAAWCGPCKALVPVMTKLSDEYKDKAGFYYADIEDGGINTGSAHHKVHFRGRHFGGVFNFFRTFVYPKISISIRRGRPKISE